VALASDLVELPLPRGVGVLRAQLALLRARGRLADVDVIHANGLTEAVVVLPLTLVLRRPTVVWVHNYAVPRPFAVLRLVAGPLFRRWRWLAVSATARDLLPASWDVEVLSNPVPTSPSPADPGRPAPCRVVYLAGTDHPVKGFDLLPAIVRATPPDAACFVVHAAPSRRSHHPTSVAAWAELEGPLAERVTIGPFVEDVAAVLRDADLVLVPSRRESFNRVLAEAIAHGVPVVASDIRPHREHFADEPVGRTFPDGDPEAAGRAITALAADPDERRRCADAGRRRAARFDPDGIADRLLGRWRSR
jgi:phosphatidylinositol alpha-mannosyltransferase